MFVQDYLGHFFPVISTVKLRASRGKSLAEFRKNLLITRCVQKRKVPDGASTDPRFIYYASGDHIDRFDSVISTVFAALLLIGAMVALYKVQSADLKLGLIGIFTIIFAGSVGLLTSARRTEDFGATAA